MRGACILFAFVPLIFAYLAVAGVVRLYFLTMLVYYAVIIVAAQPT
jgi:hypothetical protein